MDLNKLQKIKETAFITKYGYLSVPKEWIDYNMYSEIKVNGVIYDISLLKINITYKDNIDFYRWKSDDYYKCAKK